MNVHSSRVQAVLSRIMHSVGGVLCLHARALSLSRSLSLLAMMRSPAVDDRDVQSRSALSTPLCSGV